MILELIYFKCSNCYNEFWLRTTPGTVTCPNPECYHVWAPKRSPLQGEQGRKNQYEFIAQTQDVEPEIQSQQD